MQILPVLHDKPMVEGPAALLPENQSRSALRRATPQGCVRTFSGGAQTGAPGPAQEIAKCPTGVGWLAGATGPVPARDAMRVSRAA